MYVTEAYIKRLQYMLLNNGNDQQINSMILVNKIVYWRITYTTYNAFDNVAFAKGKTDADRLVDGLSKLKHVSNVKAFPGLMYEDELPPLTQDEYDWWFDLSELVDGVRMGPPMIPSSGYEFDK